jgi:signal transduction histidine kinase/CheY-like chemotaxis protein
LAIVYFSKGRLDNNENRIYKKLIITNVVGIIIQILCEVFSAFNIEAINLIVTKLLLVYFITWIAQFLSYVLEISNIRDIKFKKLNMLLVVVFSVIVFVLPYEAFINQSEGIYYTSGLDTKFTYFLSIVYISLISLITFIKKKIISPKKTIPIYFLVGFFIISGLIQFFRPELTIIVQSETFICFIMYFTIENPDVKMLNELYKNRELMEQGYEDKYNFLFEMTQEAKRPILDLNRVTSELRQEGDPNKIKDGMAIINNLTRQLDFSINNVLNISSFDIQKLKIIDTKYDVLKVCDGLETTLRNEIKPGVTFNMELPKSVPTLYGDYMKLRQILYSLLNNASKNTENGSVNLKLNIIEKYDFCRLIFNISDTGKGMSIEKINDILSSTGELNKEEMEYLEKKEFNFKVCQKVVKIMGGNLMIKSTIGKGTDITLTLDQRVYHEKENSILNQYESAINTSKRVLIVAQNKDLVGYLKKKLNNNDITYSALAYGGDAVDRIKAGKSYDYMLIEDDMKEMSGLATLQELQKLKNFDIPVIIMLNKDKDSIKEHYIEDGFTDYLLTDNLEEEIKRIIDKY